MTGWKKWTAISMGAVVLILAGVKVTVDVLDRADPVDTDAVVEDFESASASAEDSVAAAEGFEQSDDLSFAPGAYIYTATGTEYIDLLGGPLHEFPPEVVTTVEANDCGGSTINLQLFEQRNDLLDLCATGEGGLSVREFTTRHEFVGIEDVTTTSCPDNELFPPGAFSLAEGTEVSAACTATGANAGTVDAEVTLTVLGTDEGGLHLRLASVVGRPTDPTRGTYDNELWITADGVIAGRTLDADVVAATPVGDVGFKETFDLALLEG